MNELVLSGYKVCGKRLRQGFAPGVFGDSQAPSSDKSWRTNSTGKPVGNTILLSMPDAEHLRMRRQLEFLDLPNHLSLREPPKKQRFVYFLNRGLASIVVAMREGKNVEAGVVGYEGAVGVAVGSDRSPLRTVMNTAAGH